MILIHSLFFRSNTANRSLPDIPKDRNTERETESELRDIIYENTENIGGDLSELYATVQDKSNILSKIYNLSEILFLILIINLLIFDCRQR